MKDVHIQTIRELSELLDIGDEFIVENGSWRGKLLDKTDKGVVLNMYTYVNHQPVRENVFYGYNYVCDLDIMVKEPEIEQEL